MANNPRKNRWLKEKRRIKYGMNPSTFQKNRKKALIKRDGAKCKKCGSEEELTIDHIFASAFGGASDLSNLQLLCLKCNREKAKEEQAQFHLKYIQPEELKFKK